MAFGIQVFEDLYGILEDLYGILTNISMLKDICTVDHVVMNVFDLDHSWIDRKVKVFIFGSRTEKM